MHLARATRPARPVHSSMYILETTHRLIFCYHLFLFTTESGVRSGGRGSSRMAREKGDSYLRELAPARADQLKRSNEPCVLYNTSRSKRKKRHFFPSIYIYICFYYFVLFAFFFILCLLFVPLSLVHRPLGQHSLN